MLPLVTAAIFIRKMRGNSQALLVEGTDQCLYVVKMRHNSNSSISLANELIGGLLCNALGLPIPPSRLVQITERFLDQCPEAGFQTPAGLIRPPVGLHYGTAFLGTIEGSGRPFELLDSTRRRAIINGDQFCGMYLFDIWANHLARRQSLYLEDTGRKTINTVFLDNGLLFGGSPRSFSTSASQDEFRRRDAAYVRWQHRAVLMWFERFRATIPNALRYATKLVPSEWYTGDLVDLEHHLLLRLGAIEEVVKPFVLQDN